MNPQDAARETAIEQTEAELSALAAAERLIASGVPVFVAKAAMKDGRWDPSDGTGQTGYWLPAGWQNTQADPSTLDGLELGRDALCAVMGQGLDVIDIDPRHGGDHEIRRIESDLPAIHGVALTPSGGEHRFVATLGVNSKDGILPGVDFKGGNAEGKGRGYAFIAPTARRGKVSGLVASYAWTKQPVVPYAPDHTGWALRELIKTGTTEITAPRAADRGEVPAGERDNAARDYAWKLAHDGCSIAVARAAMETWWRRLDQPVGDEYPLQAALDKITPAFAKVDGGIEAEIAKAERTEMIRTEARDRIARAKAAEALAGAAQRMRSRSLTFAEALELKPQPYLVDGLIPGPGVAMFAADPATYKSFVALDIACHVAAGSESWHGLGLRTGRAAYVMAEGASGLGQRVRAWAEQNPTTAIATNALLVFPEPVDLSIPGAGEPLAEWLGEADPSRPLRLVVLDTLRRVSGTLNENLAEIGIVIDNLAPSMRAHPEAAFVIVHHFNKQGVMSGSTALKGNADAVLTFVRGREPLTVRIGVDKQKDADGDVAYDVTLVARGRSLAVASVEAAAERPMSKLNSRQIRILDRLRDAGSVGAGQSDVNNDLGLDRSDASADFRGLEALGLIERAAKPEWSKSSSRIFWCATRDEGPSRDPSRGAAREGEGEPSPPPSPSSPPGAARNQSKEK